MMLSGVPNFAFAIGYTNSSWTLKIGLAVRVLLPAAAPHGRQRLRHRLPRVADPAMPTRPLLDFGAGYVQRSLADLPQARTGRSLADVDELRT